MKPKIDAINFEVNDQLLDFINQGVDKLDKVHNRIENCNVILRIDKNNKQKDKVVEISVNIPGTHLFAIDKSENFEMASKLALEEIKKQLINHKQKSKNWDEARKILLS